MHNPCDRVGRGLNICVLRDANGMLLILEGVECLADNHERSACKPSPDSLLVCAETVCEAARRIHSHDVVHSEHYFADIVILVCLWLIPDLLNTRNVRPMMGIILVLQSGQTTSSVRACQFGPRRFGKPLSIDGRLSGGFKIRMLAGDLLRCIVANPLNRTAPNSPESSSAFH